MRSPVKYSKWEQPDEPDRETPNPFIVIASVVGLVGIVFGVLALVWDLLP